MKGGDRVTTWVCTRQNELTHYGIKGQKWGVRRFQNKDGSLTPAGKKRYDDTDIIVRKGDEIHRIIPKEWLERENGPFGIEKVIQGAKTESVPLGELKKLAEERMLLFDEELMTFAMGNCITLEDTNGNRKLLKKRYDQKIDAVAAMMDGYVAYKLNKDAFE